MSTPFSAATRRASGDAPRRPAAAISGSGSGAFGACSGTTAISVSMTATTV
jgi:hypothetical protein